MTTTNPTCPARYHGTATAYTKHGCRCEQSLAAWRRYRKYRAAGIQPPGYCDATGTHRRLQALQALGHSQRVIATELGTTDKDTVSKILTRSHVYPRTAARVAELYERWAMTRGESRITANLADKKGWHPPLAWEGVDIDNPTAEPITDAPTVAEPDPVVVDRLLKGRLTAREVEPTDRDEAIRALAARGHSTTAIARHLGTAHHVVTKARTAGKESAA